jgi:asparagine synthase (glutamine-hydrolysing)
MVDAFPALNYWRDDPIADISGFGYFMVNKLAREHGISVLLQGQGGDELFWGYEWMRQAAVESTAKRHVAADGWHALTDVARFEWPDHIGPRTFLNWFRNAFGVRAGLERFLRYRNALDNRLVFYELTPDFRLALNETLSLYAPEFEAQLSGAPSAERLTFPLPSDRPDIRLTALICSTYLLENGIAQGDRLSMASSVELRLPLIDYKLVELVIGLRKMRPDYQLSPKRWLKDAIKDVVPPWVMNRVKKGFAPPIDRWYDALFRAYGERLDGGYLVTHNVLSPRMGRYLSAGPRPASAVMPLSFKALVLEQWCREMSNLDNVAHVPAFTKRSTENAAANT